MNDGKERIAVGSGNKYAMNYTYLNDGKVVTETIYSKAPVKTTDIVSNNHDRRRAADEFQARSDAKQQKQEMKIKNLKIVGKRILYGAIGLGLYVIAGRFSQTPEEIKQEAELSKTIQEEFWLRQRQQESIDAGELQRMTELPEHERIGQEAMEEVNNSMRQRP